MFTAPQAFMIFSAGAFSGAVFVALLVLTSINRGISDE